MFAKHKKTVVKTWRAIRQPSFTRSATPLGWAKQLKKFLKLSFYGLGVILLVASVLFWKMGFAGLSSPFKHANLAKGKVLTQLVFKTNGFLSESYVRRQLALPADIGLLELDLQAMKQGLEALPQVKSVSLEKELPDKLILSLTEYQPLARLAIRTKDKKTKILFLAEEGHIFEPAYLPKSLQKLPWLEGISLHAQPNASMGFEPLLELASLEPLLSYARQYKPKLYAQFKKINCQQLDKRFDAPWSCIHIHTSQWGEWVFATHDYPKQLERLELILNELAKRPSKRVKTIDLSLDKQAVVRFL